MARLIGQPPRRRKKSRPLRPTTTSVTSGALDWRMKASARRVMFEVDAPPGPRAARVVTIFPRGHERRLRVTHGRREALTQRVRDLPLLADLGEDPGRLSLEPAEEVRLEVPHRVHREVVEKPLRSREDDRHLLLDGQRPVLALLQDLDHARAARELKLGRPVEVAPDLREGGELAKLCEVEPQLPGHLAHRPDLRRTADPRDRQTDVHRGAGAAVEEVRLEVDLPVGDGDDVRRNVRGHVAELGLDDRQRRQRAAAERVVELRRALEQPRVQVEHVPRVRLAPGRPPEQERELPVCRGVLGEVVVDAERVALGIAEVLPHRDAGIRRDVLERRRLGRRGHDDRGVTLDRPKLVGVDRALGVHRLAERVDDPTSQRLADRHLGDPVRPPDDVAFLDERVVAEEHRADPFLLEVEDHPDDVAGELEQLARHRPLEPVDARDAVADLDDAADLLQVHLRLVARELLPDDLADLSGLDHPCPLTSRSRNRASWPSRLPSTRRLPISATNPPRSAPSTASSSTTCLPPNTRLSRPASVMRSPSASTMAVRTRPRTRPAAASTSSRYAAAMPGRCSARPRAATSARKSRRSGPPSSRAATSAAALRLTAAVIQGRPKTARNAGSWAKRAAAASSPRPTASACVSSCASENNAFA